MPLMCCTLLMFPMDFSLTPTAHPLMIDLNCSISSMCAMQLQLPLLLGTKYVSACRLRFANRVRGVRPHRSGTLYVCKDC